MEDFSRSSMNEIRRFLSGESIGTFAHGTLIETLREDAKFVRDGLGVRVIVESEPDDLDLPHDIEREIYFILKEGITNVAKHSHAAQVAIFLKQNGGMLSGSLTDDGVGFDYSALRKNTGFGLTGMTNRLKKIGGELYIKSSPGTGTKISFAVPLRLSKPISAQDRC
jgi:signal transduction histidine kinase